MFWTQCVFGAGKEQVALSAPDNGRNLACRASHPMLQATGELSRSGVS